MSIIDRRWKNTIPISFCSNEEFENYPMKEYLSITFVSNGRAEIVLNGKKKKLAAPFFLCVTERDVVTFLQKEDYFSAQTFSFSPSFLNAALIGKVIDEKKSDSISILHDINLLRVFFERSETELNGIINIDTSSVIQLREWFSIIGGEVFMQSDYFWSCRIRKYLLQILFFIDDMCDKSKNTTHPNPALEHRGVQYIQEHYREKITLDCICKELGTNRTTLNNRMKEVYGCTIMQYLQRYRIELAKDILSHTNLSLAEVSYACGFEYESYFVRVFSNVVGVTPSRYRNERK